MKSLWTSNLSFSLFGESHGRGVGISVHGLKAGIKLNEKNIEEEMRRRHARSEFGSERVEADEVIFLSGLRDGYTTGAPLTLFLENKDIKSKDYEAHFDVPRPSHSDYVNRLQNGPYADVRGGGHFSGRLTAPLVALAGFLREELDRKGLRTLGHISQLGPIRDEIELFRLSKRELEELEEERASEMRGLRLPMFGEKERRRAEDLIRALREEGDSIGGSCEIAVLGLPAGLGEPFFEGLESRLGALLFSLPGVKAVEFGLGAAYADMRGSEANDAFCLKAAEGAGVKSEGTAVALPGGNSGQKNEASEERRAQQEDEGSCLGQGGCEERLREGFRRAGKDCEGRYEGEERLREAWKESIETRTNYAGGISGGISNGMPLVVKVTFRPTPSIAVPQGSVSLSRLEETEISVSGRHDACIALKGLRAMDAALRLALCDYLL